MFSVWTWHSIWQSLSKLREFHLCISTNFVFHAKCFFIKCNAHFIQTLRIIYSKSFQSCHSLGLLRHLFCLMQFALFLWNWLTLARETIRTKNKILNFSFWIILSIWNNGVLARKKKQRIKSVSQLMFNQANYALNIITSSAIRRKYMKLKLIANYLCDILKAFIGIPTVMTFSNWIGIYTTHSNLVHCDAFTDIYLNLIFDF